MDIMDNYPECTTQPHSCVQLRPKQLPPPLHPSSSLHDNFLQLFSRSWYLPDTTKRRARQVIQGLESGGERCMPWGQSSHWNRADPGVKGKGHSEFMQCSGISSCGGKKYFLKKQSRLISWQRCKATGDSPWLGSLAFMWAFWISVNFFKKAGALCHLFIIFFTIGRRATDSIMALQRVITRFTCSCTASAEAQGSGNKVVRAPFCEMR